MLHQGIGLGLQGRDLRAVQRRPLGEHGSFHRTKGLQAVDGRLQEGQPVRQGLRLLLILYAAEKGLRLLGGRLFHLHLSQALQKPHQGAAILAQRQDGELGSFPI